MATNFDNVDVSDFGHALNDDVTGLALEQAVRNLASASARAQRDQQYREAVLRREGTGLDTDAEWGRLMAKAKRMESLRYALSQNVIMARAKAQSGIDGPYIYQVTEAECQHKKAAAESALADFQTALKNAVEVGLTLPDVQAYVNELARRVAVGDCRYKLAEAQSACNGRRNDLVVSYEQLMASARLVCAAGTEGERRLLGVRLLTDKKAYEETPAAFNAASQHVVGAKDKLEAVLAYQAANPVGASTSTSARPWTSNPVGSSSPSFAYRSSTSANRHGYGRADYQLERRPSFASTGLGRADYRLSTSSARQDFEALLASLYGGTSTDEGIPTTAAVLEAVSASRHTTTTTTAVQRIGPWTVTETSVVDEQFQAVRIRQLTMSWEHVFGAARAESQQPSTRATTTASKRA